MANWSYNGTILPEFPTDFGEYSDSYLYHLILYYVPSGRYFALAYSEPFIVKSSGKQLYCPGYHGEYSFSDEMTEWNYVNNRTQWESGYLALQDQTGFQVVWTDHDIIYDETGSVYLLASDPVSPGSVITKLTTNVSELRLNRGEVFQFMTVVEGTEIFSERVIYSLSGNDANGGTTLSADGLLTVGETEHSSVFTVTVTSRQDMTVSQTITVTVADYLSKLNLNVVTDLYNYNETVLPEFPTDWGEYSDIYPYRMIIWGATSQRWYAMASSEAFTVQGSGTSLKINLGYQHGEYSMDIGYTAWTLVGYSYISSGQLSTTGEWAYQIVWANHDVKNLTDETVYVPKSEPVRICNTVPNGNGTVYQVIGPTVWLDGACIHLNETDPVYTVKAWLYRIVDGLNTALPPTWTSETFGGPTWSQRLSFSDLEDDTRYGLYAVVCVHGVATDHNALATFTTGADESETPVLFLTANQITGSGFNLYLLTQNLESGTQYTAEVNVCLPGGDVVFYGELTIDGAGVGGGEIDYISVTGLEPETEYTVYADIYPAPSGEVVLHGEYTVTTTDEIPVVGYDRDSFLLGFASGLGCTAATKDGAEYNSWTQGCIVGAALRKALRKE